MFLVRCCWFLVVAMMPQLPLQLFHKPRTHDWPKLEKIGPELFRDFFKFEPAGHQHNYYSTDRPGAAQRDFQFSTPLTPTTRPNLKKSLRSCFAIFSSLSQREMSTITTAPTKYYWTTTAHVQGLCLEDTAHHDDCTNQILLDNFCTLSRPLY